MGAYQWWSGWDKGQDGGGVVWKEGPFGVSLGVIMCPPPIGCPQLPRARGGGRRGPQKRAKLRALLASGVVAGIEQWTVQGLMGGRGGGGAHRLYVG
jgi:hypothetical protein